MAGGRWAAEKVSAGRWSVNEARRIKREAPELLQISLVPKAAIRSICSRPTMSLPWPFYVSQVAFTLDQFPKTFLSIGVISTSSGMAWGTPLYLGLVLEDPKVSANSHT